MLLFNFIICVILGLFLFFPLSWLWGTCFCLFACLLSFYWMLDIVFVFNFPRSILFLTLLKNYFGIPLSVVGLFLWDSISYLGTILSFQILQVLDRCRLIWPHHWDSALMNWQMRCVLGGASILAGPQLSLTLCDLWELLCLLFPSGSFLSLGLFPYTQGQINNEPKQKLEGTLQQISQTLSLLHCVEKLVCYIN